MHSLRGLDPFFTEIRAGSNLFKVTKFSLNKLVMRMYLMRYKIYIYVCSTFFKYLVLTYFYKILEIEVFKYSPVIVEIFFHIGFNLMHTAICKK